MITILFVVFVFYLMYPLGVNGKELKKRRMSLGLSQTELARILEVKPNTVSRWEANRLPISKTVELALEAVKRRMESHGVVEAEN
jgi:transcriptional regulator with XRE-family HTH domain